jgi:endonuclease YncB( thermonuclease family)
MGAAARRRRDSRHASGADASAVLCFARDGGEEALRLIGTALLLAAAFGVLWLRARGDSAPAAREAVVEHVVDGDTLALVGGGRVRLVQIDAPEKGEECYGDRATRLARRLLPRGARVRIEQDPHLDQVDQYRRQLAYVFRDDENVNVTLVRRGAAGVWFFRGARGRYAAELLQAAREARADRRGLWGACPQARFDPLAAVATGAG